MFSEGWALVTLQDSHNDFFVRLILISQKLLLYYSLLVVFASAIIIISNENIIILCAHKYIHASAAQFNNFTNKLVSGCN